MTDDEMPTQDDSERTLSEEEFDIDELFRRGCKLGYPYSMIVKSAYSWGLQHGEARAAKKSETGN